MLEAFLRELAARPSGYGRADCGLPLADWVMLARGVSDPAAKLRGTYSTEAECEALLRARGGLWRIVTELAASVGLSRSTAPKPGDIAVVEIARQHWGAILSPSGFWRIKANDGATGVKTCVVRRAWSVL